MILCDDIFNLSYKLLCQISTIRHNDDGVRIFMAKKNDFFQKAIN
jgi:hypothetical protein